MPDEKVYQQEIVSDAPFPGEPIVLDTQSESPAGGNYAPTTTKEKPFKQKKIATELISQALNTHSRKILQEFELVQSGGIKVGDFKEGISGDLRITPSGLTARDKAGITTFAIDGTDGSAVFKGIIQAADFIVADENGLISLNNFRLDSVEDVSVFTTNQNGVYVDITNMTLTFDLTRTSRVLMMFGGIPYVTSGSGMAFIYLNIDGTLTLAGFTSRLDSSGGKWGPVSGMYVANLSAGSHTIKLQMTGAQIAPTIEVAISNKFLSYLVLGS